MYALFGAQDLYLNIWTVHDITGDILNQIVIFASITSSPVHKLHVPI